SDPDTIVLMRDLLARHDPDTLRALLLSSHYRRPIDFGPSRLDEIDRGLQSFRHLFERFERLTGSPFYDLPAPAPPPDLDAGPSPLLTEVGEHRRRFLDAMDDDFNTGGALGELFEIVRALNRFADRELARLDEWRSGVVVLRELTAILGLFRRAPASSA